MGAKSRITKIRKAISYNNVYLYKLNVWSTSVSKRTVHVNDLPVSVTTVTSWPGLMSLTLLGRLIVNRSCPVKPRVSASSPALKHRGIMPIPTRLLRWILSKLLAITALTPCTDSFMYTQWRQCKYITHVVTQKRKRTSYLEHWSLGSPITGASTSILSTRQDDSIMPFILVFLLTQYKEKE